jgi:hypothetical protein
MPEKILSANRDRIAGASGAVTGMQMIEPPCTKTEDGRPRRIGVEMEFIGVSCDKAADLVRDLYGGHVRSLDPYRFEVADSRLGTFTVELDCQYAHPSDNGQNRNSGRGDSDIGAAVRAGLASAIGAVSSLLVPVEIVSPPVPLSALPDLDRLVPALRDIGAEDTKEGLVYAFATQLNPEVPSLRAASVVAHLKAFLLLAGRLRVAIDVDLLRRALPFIKPFPTAYAQKVVDPHYQPELPQFVDDYIAANPTRNRELDLLPLLAELAPEQVRASIDDTLVKPRPTFHYRMPDTRLSDPGWGLIVEWNRWAEVEMLAADPGALARLGEIFVADGTGRRDGLMLKEIDAWRSARQSGGL